MIQLSPSKPGPLRQDPSLAHDTRTLVLVVDSGNLIRHSGSSFVLRASSDLGTLEPTKC